MDSYKINLYIGSDNKTKKINISYLNKCCDILNKYFDGYNLALNSGYYKAIKEDSLTITIFKNDSLKNLKILLNDICTELKNQLNQECILYEIQKAIYSFI